MDKPPINWSRISQPYHPLVILVLTRLKNMSSSMGRIIPYMKWNIKKKFETTSQSQKVAA